MRRKMHISKIGLKLIKAYEGYRPVDRHLVNGHHVVGYGHLIEGDDSLVLTRPEAEDLLRSDLGPFEDMINETVHAPMSQSQYDALVSLAFNIGPRAFTQSDTLRALNNGRPLDAASGFDIWRKSTIDGKTYVVDALMRRRAAEKALFLRTEGKKTLPASRADLPPVKDEMVALLTTEDALPIISNDPRNGIVARVPYEADEISETALEGELGDPNSDDASKTAMDTVKEATKETGAYLTVAAPEAQITQDEKSLTYARRREDGPSGILELSEVYEEGMSRERTGGIDDDLVDATYEVDDYDYEYVDVADDAAKGDADNLAATPEVTPEVTSGADLEADKPIDESSTLIADTASELSERLDALIDNVASDDAASKTENWPESLLQTGEAISEAKQTDAYSDTGADIVSTVDADMPDKPADIIIDNLVEDDAFRERTDSAAKYINIEPPEVLEGSKEGIGYFIPLLIGMCLIGASAGAIFGNPTAILGEWGPLLSFIGLVIGVIMTSFTAYYAVKTKKPM